MKWNGLKLRDITIKRKLVLIVMLTTLTALLISTLAYIGNDLITARNQMREDLSGTAAMLGATCTAALAFNDPESAAATLAALKAKPWIVAASLFGTDGQRFARYEAQTSGAMPEDDKAESLRRTVSAVWLSKGRFAYLWLPVVLDGQQIGVISLTADTAPLMARVRRQVAIAMGVFLAAALIAWAFAARLQRLVSVPVLNMLRAMNAVTRERNYGARAESWGRDELGKLVDGLNDMLGRIETHVEERKRYSETLENQVAERTVDLVAAKEKAEAASAANEARDVRLYAQNEALARLVVEPALHGGDLAAAARLITESAARTLAVERASLWVFAEDRSAIECLDLFEAGAGRHSSGQRLAVREHPAYFRALESARTIVAHEAQTDPRTRSMADDYLRPTRIQSMLDAGVRHEGRVAGVVCFEHVAAPRRWELDEESFAGSLADLVGLALDACDRRKAREEIVAAKEAAEAANRAKSRFLANMSHEIRTPMNGILGMAELLAETELTDRQKNFSDAIRGSGEHLLRIINDILDFSKVEAGHIELESLNFDLRQLLEQVLDLHAEQAARKGVELILDAPPDLPHHLRGDPGRLRQVLMNLVGNAIKFTDRGEVVVRASAGGGSDGKPVYRFEVADTGIGIPSEQQARLFNSFMQVDTSTTRKYGGTGLGLAISREIVRLMGGEIGVESAAGKGSTFWFEAPIEQQVERRRRHAPQAGFQDLRALIVDDNRTNRDILTTQLASWGLRPSAVDSADAALALLADAARTGDPYRLGILDLHMPDKDGLMLARAIREDTTLSEFPLIMLTSGDSERTLREAMAAGINQYVRKPIRQSDLYECVLDVLGLAPGAGVPRAERRAGAAGRDKIAGRVLLAEDNIINQEVARAMLQLAGCTVEVVEDGLRAVERVFEGAFDVVLMDCQMPRMDGYEAAREIRRQETLRQCPRRMPIVAITANALQGDREKCIEAGMDDYLTKPLQLAELRRVLLQSIQLDAPADTTQGATTATAAVPQPVAEPPQTSSPSGGVPEGADLPVFVRADVLKRCLGDEQLMASLVQVFVAQAGEDLAEIRAGVAGGDAPKALRAAHRLKGSSSNLALERIRQAALALETHVRTSGTTDAEPKVATLRADFEALVAVVGG